MNLRTALAEPRTLAVLDQMVVSGCNFFSLLYVGRKLALDEFGLFSLAMMSMMFLANMHRAVFTQPLNVLGASDDVPHLTARMGALLRAHWFAIPVALGVLVLLSLRYFPDAALFLACACYVACFFLQEIVRRYWYTMRRTDRALFNDVLSYGGQLLVLLIAGSVFAIDGVLAFSIMAVTSLFAFAVGVRRIELKSAPPANRSRLLRQHWSLARWLVPTVLTVWGATQAYPFLMASLGPAAVAAFAASRNLLNAAGILIQSVDNYLPVRAAAVLRRDGKRALGAHLLQTLGVSAVGGALFVGAMALAAEPLLNLLYDGLYDHAAPLFRVLALSAVFGLIGTVLGSYSLAMSDSRASFLANLGATAFTFSGGLWLIQQHGAIGAAAAAVLSTATAMTLQGLLVFARFKGLPTERTAHA